ncbi:MAG: AAA family ATPase [Oscillospiraceae bacterium]|nr:AAA family ATPase [Oscillospiraceae bacterium]
MTPPLLKSMDAHLRFVFITGVSKFTKTSLFSGLNNLTDITMLRRYANICGIPVENLEEYFGEHIERLRDDEWFKNCENTAEIKEQILWWYDGYSWDGETKLLNPFSLLSFFWAEKFHSFWYASGSPKFLLDYIKRQPETYVNLANCKITEPMLDSVDIDKIEVELLLFYTGYLTVKEILQPVPYSSPVYVIDIPNFEVREAFAFLGRDDIEMKTERG